MKVSFRNLYSRCLQCNLPGHTLLLLHFEVLCSGDFLLLGFLLFLLCYSLYKCKFCFLTLYTLRLSLPFLHPRCALFWQLFFQKKVLFRNLYSRYLPCNLPGHTLLLLHFEVLCSGDFLLLGFLLFSLCYSLYKCRFWFLILCTLQFSLSFQNPKYDLFWQLSFQMKVSYHSLCSKYLRCNLPGHRSLHSHFVILYSGGFPLLGFLLFLLYYSLCRYRFLFLTLYMLLLS